MKNLVEKIVYALTLVLLDWLEKRIKNSNTMENAAKPLPPDAIAFRNRLRIFLQNTSGSGKQ